MLGPSLMPGLQNTGMALGPGCMLMLQLRFNHNSTIVLI